MSLIEALLDSALDAVLLVDARGRLALVNRRAEELFGYGSGALFGSEVELLVPERLRSEGLFSPGDRSTVARPRRMGAGRQLWGLREDASEFPIEISISPIAIEFEHFVIVIIHDVSDRQAAERERSQLLDEREAHAEAEHARRRLAAILGDVNAIVWEADARRRRFSFVNVRAEDLLGYPLSAWLDAEDFWRHIVAPEDLALAELYFEEAVARASDHEHEYRVRRADGQVVWVRDCVRVARNDDGSVSRLHGVTVDVTARRALQRRLIHAQKMDAVAQLAEGIAHDFGNLLSVIARHAELLLERVSDDVARARLQDIGSAADRASELVSQLLAFRGRSERAGGLAGSGAPGAAQALGGGEPGESGEERAARVALVVEEESDVRGLVRSVLEQSGYRVREAASGGDALACLERAGAEIDLIVSDVVMADMTGPELAAGVAPLGHATPVLFMSGYADSRLLSRGGEEGSIGVLHKPFTPAELAAGVAQVVSEGQAPPPGA